MSNESPELTVGVGVRMQWPHGDQYGYVVEVKPDWVRAIRYDGEELAGNRKFFTTVPEAEMPPYTPPEGIESDLPPELAQKFEATLQYPFARSRVRYMAGHYDAEQWSFIARFAKAQAERGGR